MSNIKHYLHQKDEDEQDLMMMYLDWIQENEELFKQLSTPTPNEVIGYEET